MKKLFLLSLALLSSIASFAYDFEVDGILYHILSERNLTCEVTSAGKAYDHNIYFGDVVIPSTVTYNEKRYTVTSIGERALRNSPHLTSVISKMEKPCYLESNSFDDVAFKYATLYVPKGTIDLYKSISIWNKFFFIEEGDGPNADGIEGLKISGDDSEIAVYDLKGAAVYKGRKAEMPGNLKGLYIVKLGGRAVKCRL